MLRILHQGLRQREPRTAVLLPARMKLDTGWADATIHNVSSRGLMAAADAAPAPGAYVDIRRGRNIIVGRVVWRKDRFFGVRAQDRIDLAALSAPPQRKPAPGGAEPIAERRGDDRLRREIATARRLERHRALARFGQFAAVGAVAAAACVAVATEAYDALSAPARQINAALSPSHD